MSFAIWGIDTAIPTHSIEQNDAAELSKAYCCQTRRQDKLLTALDFSRYRRIAARRGRGPTNRGRPGYIEKLAPQPQVPVALGLLILNPEPLREST